MAGKSAKAKSSKKSAKTAAKKTAAKKASSAKRLPGNSRKQLFEEQLRNEIRAMILTLNADSLKKLLQDATILAHNERVLADYAVSTAQNREAPRGRSVLAEVEEGRDGTYYIIILNSYRNFLSLDEMRKLVALCHKASDPRDAADRLFAWVENARRDIKKNSMIDDPDDPSLAALWEKIINNYALK